MFKDLQRLITFSTICLNKTKMVKATFIFHLLFIPYIKNRKLLPISVFFIIGDLVEYV